MPGYEPESDADTVAREKKYWEHQKNFKVESLDKSLPALKEYIVSKQGSDPLLVDGIDHTYDTGPAKKGGGCLVM